MANAVILSGQRAGSQVEQITQCSKLSYIDGQLLISFLMRQVRN